MKQNRRDFLKSSGIITGSALLPYNIPSLFPKNKSGNGKMKLTFTPYNLELKHVFTIASNSRTTTPVMLTEIEYEGIKGYGEASMPPYLGESHKTASDFLSKVDLGKYKDVFDLENILLDIDAIAPGNTAAKASVDIALHDLIGKLMGQPWYKIWGFDKTKTPYTTFTIGIDTLEMIKQKVNEASEFKILKVKLGSINDKEIIETIRTITDKPLTTDVNQGWKDKFYALDMINWLHEKGVLLIEQPLPKEMRDDLAWLTEQSPLPVIGDESVQRLPDILKAHGVYSGINIKLMKCTGMREAHKMLTLAKSLGLRLMMGCMVESSCAISAASHLTPIVEWADLDGALLINNDPFTGTEIINGEINITDSPGIGAIKK